MVQFVGLGDPLVVLGVFDTHFLPFPQRSMVLTNISLPDKQQGVFLSGFFLGEVRGG